MGLNASHWKPVTHEFDHGTIRFYIPEDTQMVTEGDPKNLYLKVIHIGPDAQKKYT